MKLCFCLILVTSVLALLNPARGSELALTEPILVVQVAPSSGAVHDRNLGGRNLEADDLRSRLLILSPDGTRRLLSEGLYAAIEPDVSFDGSRVLFAGKQDASDPWVIFEMEVDGSHRRTVTGARGNSRSPSYQSTLYTIVSAEPWYQITFVSDALGECDPATGQAGRDLFSCRLDGSQRRRLTFSPFDETDPFVMYDGRILYAARQADTYRHGSSGRMALFSVNSDGTDVALFAGDEGRRVKRMPCATEDGWVVFVEPDEPGTSSAGQLSAVTIRRNFHSYRQITTTEDGLFTTPASFGVGRVLASRKAPGQLTFGVSIVEPESGDYRQVFDDPEWHDLYPHSIRPRFEPDGRSSVVTESDPNGQLFALNVGITDPLGQPDLQSPGGLRLRILEGVPAALSSEPTAETGSALASSPKLTAPFGPQKRILGEMPVAPDGSFLVEIPANLPVQVQLLDQSGMAVRSCAWIWVGNHEPRGCIGCHEDPELTPPNRFVDAVQRRPFRMNLPPGRRRTVEFEVDVVPVVANGCAMASCHGPGAAPPDLSVGSAASSYADRVYATLMQSRDDSPADPRLGKYVHAGRARTSPVIRHLVGRDDSRPWDAPLPESDPIAPLPAHSHALSADQMRALIEWIDLGAHREALPRNSGNERSTTTKPQGEAQ